MGKFPLKDLISNQDLPLLRTSWVGNISAGFLWKHGSSWFRRVKPSSRPSESTGLAWELCQKPERHFVSVLDVGSSTRSSPKPHVSLLTHSLPPLVLLSLLIPYLQTPFLSPQVSCVHMQQPHKEVYGSSGAPSNVGHICVLLSHQ